MIHGFLSALKTISMGAILVFLMLTLWAIVAVELLNPVNHRESVLDLYMQKNCARCPRAWSTVSNAVFSFTQLMIMGESWDLLSIPLIEVAPWMEGLIT